MHTSAGHGALRRSALEKLATLSAKPQGSKREDSDLPRLCSLYQQPTTHDGANTGASKAPMDIRELEVLLAICRAAPEVQHASHAEQLLRQVGPYLAEAHAQTFRPSPCLSYIQPSPWEVLATDVTFAILAIAENHASLRDLATSYIRNAVDQLVAEGKSIADSGHSREGREADVGISSTSIRFTLVLLGFLASFSARAQACASTERLTLIQKVKSILSQRFMITIEGNFSSLRNTPGQIHGIRIWKRLLRQYASAGRPLGAVILQRAFMHCLASCTACFVTSPPNATHPEVLDILLDSTLPVEPIPDTCDDATLETLTSFITDSIGLLDADADFLQVSSAWQQRLVFSLKANSLTSFVCCSLMNEDIADADVLMGWLEAIIADQVQLADNDLAQTTFKCMAILARTSKSFASVLARSLPRLIVQGKMTAETAFVAADCLARILLLIPQDMRISTLYSLGNVLSVSADPNRAAPSMFFDGGSSTRALNAYPHNGNASAISLVTSDAEETVAVHGTVVQAIVQIAKRCNDEKITALAISLLVQKIGRVSLADDVKIIQGSAELAACGSANDLRPMLRVHSRICHDAIAKGDNVLLQAIMDARVILARGILVSSPLYEIYLNYLLDSIVSTSRTTDTEYGSNTKTTTASEEIGQMLPPLAALLNSDPSQKDDWEDIDALRNLTRDAWFNLVANDYTLKSSLTARYLHDLQTIAWYSPSLIDKDRTNARESGIELNTVLRRNMNQTHTAQQRAALISAFPSCEADIKGLEYAELTFLNAANLIAVLRARAGDCTRTMQYFFDPKFKAGPLSSCLLAISQNSVDTYLSRTRTALQQDFAAPELATQLIDFFQGACHRIAKVQHVAVSAADRIISQVPSALCQRSSLFAMLELLTLMWTSCLEAETDEYEWKSDYSSARGKVSVQLSDDFTFRRQTLSALYRRSRTWVSGVMDVAPLDMKGLLQTYLSDFEDDGAYGHISLGRSFALEMGCLIPTTDRRLGAFERQTDLSINSASDFIAQYTTRQEYRPVDSLAVQDDELAHIRRNSSYLLDHADIAEEVREATASLKDLKDRLDAHHGTSPQELRSVLRRAAALLCRTDVHNTALVQYLVSIPYALFTKQSIKLGISLWMGVLRENSKLESRILAEVALNAEASVRRKRGIFSPNMQHLDPFYVKEEFAPTDRDAIAKRQQHTHDIIAPHYRILQFLSSHFNATRLSSPSLESMFFRLARTVLTAMRHGASQPLAREVHFQLVLVAIRVLVNGTKTDDEAKWTLKDQILSAALLWFRQPPRWSFGGNKLQLKAEVRLIGDVLAALQNISAIGNKAHRSMQSLQSKQELLVLLLQSESQRLSVWLSPLVAESSHLLGGSAGKTVNEATLSALLPVAWTESASLAVQMAVRFQSQRIQNEVRGYLLRYPSRALDEPEALHIMIGPSLPKDVTSQLKYLLYWTPVNPITAVTYFLPAYGNHPFVIQYAVRALESHSVDVTFFYVPQVVQTLRYDALGYVERYIIETAKFSQLFAHQIIWNIKANAYKDEDSQIPDPVKPTLDKVMDALIESFSDADKGFYEREFGFFNEVTSISGKLRPFIKRPKPEKKQKIEEELRKIQVDVGVYLPSNPDGVVIGIDRKSGKPLQSHAKAPFMATFRIRKDIADDMEAVDEQIDRSAEGKEPERETTYEVWQSAIFKVGDDCRQDVLALQMIATFRGIFNNVGLDVYVFPYRVTATAPGCGVIDVLPNSISRDMLGREQVNGLYEYFLSKYGSEDSLRFQAARNNFVKSMAAYSVISYLLQFKDRHNGNIMIDDAGHILHIDFGFCFDIAPGGVRFERAPFKLTSEMVAVMGGSTESQPYHWFEELCVKAFLASRPYAEKLSHMVVVMLDSGLPCFKPETVQHFKERFVLEKTEREAADFMRKLIRTSEGSLSTRGYDQFQLLTNGIPY